MKVRYKKTPPLRDGVSENDSESQFSKRIIASAKGFGKSFSNNLYFVSPYLPIVLFVLALMILGFFNLFRPMHIEGSLKFDNYN
jgi:hypothetical protein